MNHLFESLFTILLASLLLSNVSCLTINNYEIRDLESNVASYFQTEASYWSATGNFSSTIYYQCNSNWVLGGYQKTGNNGAFTRKYTSLSSHNQIYFSVYISLIDMQESTDLFRIYFDGTLVRDWNTYGYSYSSYPGSSTCGGSIVDYTQLYVWGKVAHNSSTLTVKFQSMYVSGTNAFSIGFRSFTLLFQTTSSTPTSSSCGFVSASDSTNPSCLCASGQYDAAGSSGCAACNSACKTCAGSANTACTSCPSGSSYNGQTCITCDSSCDQCDGTTSSDCVRCASGKYLYWNGTCLSSCSSPLVTTTEGSYQSCSLPCPLGQYYYQNGTCSTTCPSPFTQSSQGDLLYCNFPCSSPTYYYSNGSCLTCTSPFTSVTKGVERYCQSPCPSSSAPYYYQNSTCLSSCASPFTQSVQGVLTYCNFPCSSSTYYYSNGSCLTCNSPFSSVTKGVERYCQSPCSASSPYYYQNSSCLSSCASPFTQSVQGVLTYCNFPCSSSAYYYSNGSCLTCSSPFTSVTKGVERYCQSPCPSSSSPYYYQNSTCLASCPSPFTQSTQGVLIYCNFPCSSSTYYYSNGSCLTCISPFTSITTGVERYCQSPCPTSGAPYYYQNSTCLASCPSPFTQSTQGVLTYCTFPCLSPDYLYSNNSCLSPCSSPFASVTKGVERYCQSPCSSSSQYYFANNQTCSTSCDSPFTSSTSGVLQSCNSPCTSSEYLYWNNTCQTSCPSPLVTTSANSNQFCNLPCASGEYYYQNSTCSSSCTSPFTQSSQGGLLYCNFPCSSSDYLYSDNNCGSPCSSPFTPIIKGVEKYCQSPCDTSEYYFANKTCGTSCNAPFTSSISGVLQSCNSPCSSSEFYDSTTSTCVSTCDSPATIVKSGVLNLCIQSTAQAFTGALGSITSGAASLGKILRSSSASGFTVALAKIVKYVQYVPVPIPEDIRIALNPFQSEGFCIAAMFVYEMPQTWQDQIPKYPLLPLFERNDNHSSYLINNWNSFSSYFFLFIMGVSFTFLERLVRKTGKKTLILIFRRLRIMTKWNFMLFTIYNTFDDLTFFAIIQFQTLCLSTAGCIVSFIVCIIGTCGAIFMLYRTFKISKESVNLKSQVADANSSSSQPLLFYKKWEDYQTIYAGYKNDSLFKQSCLLIFTLRIILCYLIVGLLYSYPLIQTVQLTILSIFMLIYLIKLRPMNDLFNTIVALTYEGLMFGVNICLILLAVYDATGRLSESLQNNLSHAILKMSSIINLCSNIFAYIYLATGALAAYRASKAYGTNGKTVWLTVPISPYSNPGMDFDDLSCVELDANIVMRAKKIARLPSKKFIAELFKPSPPLAKPADTILSFTSIDQEKGRSRNDLLRRRKFSDEETCVAPSLLSLSPTTNLPLNLQQDSESDGGLFTTLQLKQPSSGTLPTMNHHHHRNSLLSAKFDTNKRNTPDSEDNDTPKSKFLSPNSQANTNISMDGFSDVLQKLGNYSTPKSRTPQSRIRKHPSSRISKRHHPHQVLSATSKDYNRFVSLMDAGIRDQIKETAEEGLTSDRFSNSGSGNLQPSIDLGSPINSPMNDEPIKFQIEDISSSDYQNSVTSFSRKYTPSVRRQVANSNSPKYSQAVSLHRDFGDLSLISDLPLDSSKTRKPRQKRPVPTQGSINTPSAFNIIDLESPKNSNDDKVSHLLMPYSKSTRNDLGKLSSFAKTINMTTLGDNDSLYK